MLAKYFCSQLLRKVQKNSCEFSKQFFSFQRQSKCAYTLSPLTSTSSPRIVTAHLTYDQFKPSAVDWSNLDLTFEDNQTAFKCKSSLELLRAYIVFQICSSDILIRNQSTVSNLDTSQTKRSFSYSYLYGLIQLLSFDRSV